MVKVTTRQPSIVLKDYIAHKVVMFVSVELDDRRPFPELRIIPYILSAPEFVVEDQTYKIHIPLLCRRHDTSHSDDSAFLIRSFSLFLRDSAP
jgi:hypothetical protein